MKVDFNKVLYTSLGLSLHFNAVANFLAILSCKTLLTYSLRIAGRET
jgi:hypothetical protein